VASEPQRSLDPPAPHGRAYGTAILTGQIVTPREVLQVAVVRRAQFAKWANYKEWAKANFMKGLAGEVAFAEEFDLTPDLRCRARTDMGIDFETPAGTVDVKTSGRRELMVPANKGNWADIYVLALWDARSGRARLEGWTSRLIVWGRLPAPMRYGQSYRIEDLEPIEGLHRLMRQAEARAS
jgi:hypothetical protein